MTSEERERLGRLSWDASRRTMIAGGVPEEWIAGSWEDLAAGPREAYMAAAEAVAAPLLAEIAALRAEVDRLGAMSCDDECRVSRAIREFIASCEPAETGGGS